jgi:hypothetical protein
MHHENTELKTYKVLYLLCFMVIICPRTRKNAVSTQFYWDMQVPGLYSKLYTICLVYMDSVDVVMKQMFLLMQISN